MLDRVLELWERVPDAAERIEADHVDVLRQTITVAHLAGEFERGSPSPRRPCARSTPAPTRSARPGC
ncbi:hypothetical protein ACFQX6_01775 [Streptosporangium lutulentum]